MRDHGRALRLLFLTSPYMSGNTHMLQIVKSWASESQLLNGLKKFVIKFVLAGLGSDLVIKYPVAVKLVINRKIVVLDAEYTATKREVFGFQSTDVVIRVDESPSNREALMNAGCPFMKTPVYRCTEQLEKPATYHAIQYSSQLTQRLV
ncbi:hypothetical protein REBECCA_267 [Erwinia phage Rebecca]|uniref:Uncharacterized protein n=10 Tax=Agricanvirus TaxID=1984776 RepID=A0A482IGA2_9CAUD|nr:hypothetical protein REBECCA_267 [Erwinia phage Rebecca]